MAGQRACLISYASEFVPHAGIRRSGGGGRVDRDGGVAAEVAATPFAMSV
jgi:hypothetical protein